MIDKKEFRTIKGYFSALIADSNSLSNILQSNENLLLEKDEEQQTLLHYAVFNCEAALTMEPYITKKTLSVKDNQGRTPIHFATGRARILDVYKQILPLYLQKAFTTGYDFSMLDNKGDTPFHRIIANGFVDPLTGTNENMVKYILDYVPNLDVNLLSGNGLSLLGLSLSLNHFDEVTTLLEHKADPTLYYEVNDQTIGNNPLSILKFKMELASNNLEALNSRLMTNFKDESSRMISFDLFASPDAKVRKERDYLKDIYIPNLKELEINLLNMTRQLHPAT